MKSQPKDIQRTTEFATNHSKLLSFFFEAKNAVKVHTFVIGTYVYAIISHIFTFLVIKGLTFSHS